MLFAIMLHVMFVKTIILKMIFKYIAKKEWNIQVKVTNGGNWPV